jgi:hypothetical protein
MITSSATFASSRTQFAMSLWRPMEFSGAETLHILTLAGSIAMRGDKRVGTTPLRDAEPVALIRPGFICSAAGPKSLVVLT